MSNVIELMPRRTDNQLANLEKLISFCKNNSPFKNKNNWEWEHIYWDVKGICNTQARKAGFEQFIYFNRDNNKGKNVKTPRSEMEPFHHKGLSDVAKCHITMVQIESSKDMGSLQLYINAYRFLDNVLSVSGKSIAELSAHEFKLAEKDARERLQDSTFYRAGQKLEVICKFINQHGLAKHKIAFKKSAKRSETHTNSDSRIDQSSIDERAKKLPTRFSLIAVATLSNTELQGDDALFQAMTEIMFATGLRFDEIVTLDTSCLYEREIEERNVLTGLDDVFVVHELRYKAKKGGGYSSKVIADAMVPILQKGLKTALDLLAPVREVIRQLMADPEATIDFFPLLSNEPRVFVADVWRELQWSSRANMGTYLGKLDVPMEKLAHKKTGIQSLAFAPFDLRQRTNHLARQSASNLWQQVKDVTVAERLEDMLFVTQFQRHHSVKRAEEWSFTLITHTQFTDYLSGRPELGMQSIFERKNMMFEGQPVRLTSHQFRHFLSTMLELCDTVSDIEVARYFGRKYMGDNETYDHTNKTKLVMDAADDILASTGISKEQAKEAAIIFTMVDRDEALDTIGDLTTTLITAIGMCRHDYNDSPCGKHYACLRGCAEYFRVKGNQREIAEVVRIRDQQIQHVAAAKEAVAKEFHGSNNWLKSHEELLLGCEVALAIEADGAVAVGERVQIFPDGIIGCRAI